MQNDDNLLTITEAAHYMGLARQTVATMVSDDKIEIYRRGSRGGNPTLITKEACDENRAVAAGVEGGEFLSRGQAVEFLGVSDAWFSRLLRTGEIVPATLRGKRKRYAIGDLTRYKQGHVTTPREGLYRPSEAREYLGISRQALNQAVLNRNIVFQKNPATEARIKYLFTKAALDDYKARPLRLGRKKGSKNRKKSRS